MYELSRRGMLRGLGAVVVAVPRSALGGTRRDPTSAREFHVPPLQRGKRRGNERRFELTLQRGETEFFAGKPAATLGINAPYSGPVLRARRGDEVVLRVFNSIGEPSAIHWHGFRLPAVMDGGPHQSIAPGGSWTARFEVRQGASTCWYHSHQHEQTGSQVYRGLAGMFIIDDDDGDSLGLPSRYGIDDIPVLIQDRDFDARGSLRYIASPAERTLGKHGQTAVVNGVVTPVLRAQSTLLRLRLLNGSNARVFRLAFDDRRPFRVIAGDGGFLANATPLRHLTLSPAERAEIVVDVSDRPQLVLRGLPGALGRRHGCGINSPAMGAGLDIMHIDARDAETSSLSPPDRLVKPVLLTPDLAGPRRSIRLSMGMGCGHHGRRGAHGHRGGGMTINGRSFDMNRVDFVAQREVPEIWDVSNDSALPHPFHVHNVQFQILNRDGHKVQPHESGLKDTVLVGGGQTVRLLMVFRDYADADVPFMYHCHNLEHEDLGMMGQFTVV